MKILAFKMVKNKTEGDCSIGTTNFSQREPKTTPLVDVPGYLRPT